MKFENRIWKTGVLALAATLAFALFVFRVGEWTKGFNSEFLVYGQTTGTGGTVTGGTGTSVKVIPQLAIGSFDGGVTTYTTIIQVVNTSSTSVAVSGEFFSCVAGAESIDTCSPSGVDITFRTNLANRPSFTGSLSNVSLAKETILTITADRVITAGAGKVGWGRITSTGGNVTVATVFELRDGATNVLYSRVGIAASPTDMASFVIPRMRNVAAGLDVGYAIVNTGSTVAALTATLKDAQGNTLKTRSIAMGANSHIAIFTQQFFSLAGEASGLNHSFIVFDSTSSQFAAIALAFEGATQTSFPVDKIR